MESMFLFSFAGYRFCGTQHFLMLADELSDIGGFGSP
jgi:hypothetical protein